MHEAWRSKRAPSAERETREICRSGADVRRYCADSKSHPDPKGGAKNAWNEKMQKHCKALSADADKLAADAEKAADYHTMRAKELQGK